MLADIALGNFAHHQPEPKHPGERALEEHKRVIEKVRDAPRKSFEPPKKAWCERSNSAFVKQRSKDRADLFEQFRSRRAG